MGVNLLWHSSHCDVMAETGMLLRVQNIRVKTERRYFLNDILSPFKTGYSIWYRVIYLKLWIFQV